MLLTKISLIFLWFSFLWEEKALALLELQRELPDWSDSDIASPWSGNRV